jgi:heme/copper-type cytochrome/quinol oxidase subunit 1
MPPAKLFAELAFAFAVLAGLTYLIPFPGLDLYVHGVYWVVGPRLVLLFCVAASLNFAVLYYAGERFFRARWNRALSILHVCLFLSFAIGLSVAFAISTHFATGAGSEVEIYWTVVPLLIGLFGLVTSFAVFVINLALTVTHIVRAGFGSP